MMDDDIQVETIVKFNTLHTHNEKGTSPPEPFEGERAITRVVDGSMFPFSVGKDAYSRIELLVKGVDYT